MTCTHPMLMPMLTSITVRHNHIPSYITVTPPSYADVYANLDRNGFSRNQPKDEIPVHLHGCMESRASIMNERNRRREKAQKENKKKKARSKRE